MKKLIGWYIVFQQMWLNRPTWRDAKKAEVIFSVVLPRYENAWLSEGAKRLARRRAAGNTFAQYLRLWGYSIEAAFGVSLRRRP